MEEELPYSNYDELSEHDMLHMMCNRYKALKDIKKILDKEIEYIEKKLKIKEE